MPQTTKPVKIQISNQVLGGIADSEYLGINNSVAAMVGFNIHGKPGLMLVNQASTKISGNLVDSFIKYTVPCSNGETYGFSADNGKVWRIKDDGTVEPCYETVANVGESKCTGADEYNGYILWYTEKKIHRISIADALVTMWVPGAGLNWKEFNNGDKLYHPSEEVNLVLYIADKNGMTQLDGETFTQGDVVMNPAPAEHRICSLIKYITSLCYGTFVSSNVVKSLFVNWNTWSLTPYFIDDMPEVGVNSQLKTDNSVIVSAGKKGNFYAYNGQQLEQYKRIPGDWTGTKEAIVHPDANINHNGLPLFGLSNVSGNPAPQGVYSLGSYSREYPKVLNLEYKISTGNLQNVEIGSIALSGSNIYISWKDSNGETPIYGIDKIDPAAKTSGAYFDTRVIMTSRGDKKATEIEIFYRTLNGVPAANAITLQARVNHGALVDGVFTEEAWTDVELVHDAERKRYTANVYGCTIEYRVIVAAEGNNAPELEICEITY
ncbi:MAG: hypothetical protein ACD_5C00016G0011 [uncultured bacterium]|nr:MAG: hypothetical protein ACD_5C00016G0011 [uncultured bacterium]